MTSPRILIVDDQPDIGEMFSMVLKAEGFAPRVARNGADAISAILAERPDLILLDAAMPGIDGFGVARMLKADAATATIPIIMVSAHASRGSRVDGLESGAEDYLTKPVDTAELLLKIRNLLRLRKRSAREATGSSPG
jgi:DNA-binding response OmpR family regulator